jgi:DNA-binding response OmpR family regulator
MEKILVVEDNKTLGSILKQRLEKDAFSVDIVEDGFALLAYLRDAKEPDAVILDLYIPGKSGLELLDSLINKWGSAKIFIYTAQANLKSTCLRYPGVCHFFNKTEDMQSLVEAIKKELRAR